MGRGHRQDRVAVVSEQVSVDRPFEQLVLNDEDRRQGGARGWALEEIVSGPIGIPGRLQLMQGAERPLEIPVQAPDSEERPYPQKELAPLDGFGQKVIGTLVTRVFP